MTSNELARLKALERENRQLRQPNEILSKDLLQRGKHVWGTKLILPSQKFLADGGKMICPFPEIEIV